MATKLVGCGLCFAKGEPIAINESNFNEHLERVHHQLTRKEGESFRKARQRFLLENPDLGNAHLCDCAYHQEKRGKKGH